MQEHDPVEYGPSDNHASSTVDVQVSKDFIIAGFLRPRTQ
jgi:hypothetical protein